MLAGRRIGGRYQISHQIGGGGMSVVYLAHDVILNRDVAIKILRYDFTNEEELHKRFQREALSATSLAHPNIVSVYDVGEDGEMHYIVMEYIDGKTLKKYIQEYAPLSPARAVHIMKQLTSAIAHAHENGIVHRDIKPQNIMVDENGDVKVTDFGIATSLNATALTQTNSVLGTVHYLSPEQARGGIATTKSDLYSLGIVLYELLTGELPFSGESAVSIALKHLQSETPSVRAFDATIPQSLENVVLKATAKNTLHRYRSAEEMQEDLSTVLSPSRMTESKFMPPYDDDATKAMPIIKDKMPVEEMAKTRTVPITPVEKPEPVRVAPPEPMPTSMQEKPKKKAKWPLFAGLGVLMIVLGVVAMIALTPDKIVIPDVSGLKVEDATAELEALGFVVGEVKEEHSDTVEKDFVTKTSPRADLERQEGDEITLYVSLGNETTEMPNYVGQSEEQAVRLISQAEFVNHEVAYEFSNEDEGTVIEQSPKAGDDIIMDETTVKLVVSKGKEIVKVQLQNLKGWNESAINQYARSANLKIVVSKTEHSETVPAGQVISQSPKEGTSVNEGSTVNVVMSSGPVAKQEKTIVKSITIPYEPTTEESLPQIVRVYIQDKDNSMADLFEEFEITADTVYRVTLTIAEGDRGAYRIDRDLSVIAEETINFADIP